MALIVGLLRPHGFTSRLANNPEPEPIRDNKSGAYNMLGLDSLLIDPATKLVAENTHSHVLFEWKIPWKKRLSISNSAS